ncbi:hypothetical protein Poli38472_002645 [Pythium oligandrum]|uniref:PX domain-containing protein n=1 Tax=Pythium oligandrum TaxID=41045 RepID=A0A8K1FK09_PYTOL|nr:hypothetical protein Poli38472_002645 [Pythium oligandrum]|eukprot:TMW63704.1 hypothetical protein Poli38472_002645 [Pythium oligandrum]
MAPQSSLDDATQLLRPLGAVKLLPSQYSARSQTFTALRVIDSLEIRESVKQDGNRYYYVDIYFKLTRSHIPTNRKCATSLKRKPGLRVQHRFSDFINLRHELYYHAHKGHENSVPCRFCSRMMEYTMTGRGQPSLLTKMINNDEGTCRLLNRFINDILELTMTADPSSGVKCAGQRYIPQLLKQFLRPDPEDEDSLLDQFRLSSTAEGSTGRLSL